MSTSPLTTQVDISPEAVESLCNFLERRTAMAKEVDAAAALRALRSALTARERQLAVANRLWRMCVEDGWPWAEGGTQDELTALGLLKATDMRAEDSPEECVNCEGDCRTCYRAVDRIEDAAMEKANMDSLNEDDADYGR